MPPRRRPPPAAGVLLAVVAVLAGCSDDGAERQPGDEVTAGEAEVLAGLLARNAEEGGADFVVTAPFGEDSLLTLTGEVDYADAVGRAQAVTTRGDEAPEVRTVFFTADELWFGDVPGLGEALTAAGLAPAGYVRRPLAALEPGASPPLADVLVALVLNLSAAEDDDPGTFRAGDYTWEGQRSIDGNLSAEFGSPAGWTVAVDSSTDLLLQYVTELPGQEQRVTVSLADHGPRDIVPPAAEETVDGAAYPELLAAVGL
ncbi:hypothetical protein [Blastococcus sp. TF02A-26]|uniref:hypothetical protein n=1 Tax=Blastococcus sp. TF02A-26 TaxID=2250577 RepID=UPI000DE88922|nr:hypothetical protein [Blastococcus sp. TF02A-26]RBY88640.1 hypothetical protein DQ240_04365 [Blastococcus sp. TF02A-26]